MRIGEAFIEFMPTLPAQATRTLTADAQRAGQQAGQALGESVARGAEQGTRQLTTVMTQQGARAGLAMGDAAGNAMTNRIRDERADFSRAAEEVGRAGGEAAGEAAGDGMKAKMQLAGAAAGLAVGGALTVGLLKAFDTEAANDKLAAQLGAGTEMAKEFGDLAGKLYSEAYGESIQDVNNALRAVWQNGLVEEDAAIADIEAVTKKAMDLAAIMETDYDSVTKAVGQMLKTGLAGSATEAFDLITRGFQQGVDKSQDFLDTMNEYGTQFRKLGLDGATAIGLLQQGLQGGARDADVVADAFKEFSIRAVDGSTTSAEGFKALGLEADKMTAIFAKGGPGAAAALDDVIDRLNKMEDPVKRDAAGVALFGTQWEDLGGAFKSINLDTAAAGLGNIAGAAERAGTTLADNATTNIESFKRAAITTFVEVLGNQVIPKIEAVIGWFKEHETTTKVLATTLGIVTAAIIAYHVAMGVAAAATTVATVATTAWTVITRGAAIAANIWAVAQWALNAAMAANPIGLIILAIVALVAAIVLAWKNSETFRNIVMAVWNAIKVAIGAVADWFMRVVWPGIKAALDGLGAAFTWIYRNIIQPVWSGIKVAIDIAWSVIKVIFAAIQAYVNVLGAIFKWLYDNIISPVWTAIKIAIQIAWVAIRLVFGAIEIAVRLLGMAFQAWLAVVTAVWNAVKAAISAAWNWLKTTIFDPAINFIKGVLSAAWTFYSNLVSTVWNAIKAAVNAAWSWIRDNVLNPLRNFITGALAQSWDTAKRLIIGAWEAIKSPIMATWNWIKTNVFDRIHTMVTQTIPNAFSSGVSAVGRAWDGIKEKAKIPVKFVVETIINNGIIKGFNWIAEKVGAGTISPIHLGFHDGGILPGYSPGKDIHRFVGPAGILDLSGGEGILRPELTRELGPAFVEAGNRAARSGRASSFIQNFMKHGGHARYKDGGIFGGIVNGIKGAWDTFTNPVESFKKGVNALMGGLPGGPYIKGVMRSTVTKMVDGVANWITSKFKSHAGPANFGAWPSSPAAQRGDSGVWRSIVALIRSTGPLSGSFGNGYRHGDPLWHGSGRAVDWMGFNQDALARFLAAKRPLELIHRTNNADYAYTRGKNMGSFNAGLMEAHRNHIHIAMRMGGILKRLGIFDNGGWLSPGGIGVNLSNRREAVLTADESAGLKAMGTDKLVDLLEELIEAVREVAPGVGTHIRGSGKRLITQARGV